MSEYQIKLYDKLYYKKKVLKQQELTPEERKK